MDSSYSFLFFGSEPIGPLALEALRAAGCEPAYVVDDPKLTLDEQLELVDRYRPTFFLVVGYGAILKRDLLDTVAGQVLNIHPSYLPEYRGPAPVVQTILDGATESGVTLMEIDEKMDHGPILAQERVMLRGDETPDDLYRLLTRKGVDLFLQNIDQYLADQADLVPQNHAEATFTHFIRKEQGALDLTRPAEELERQVRAFQGWPRSWIDFRGKRVIIDKARLEKRNLRFLTVQPENGKPMTWEAFCAGQRLSAEAGYKEIGLE